MSQAETVKQTQENSGAPAAPEAARPSYYVDLDTVFSSAEAQQERGYGMANQETANGMRALHAMTVPALELALAALAESSRVTPLPETFFGGVMPAGAAETAS